jgi:hypothetical protein
MMSLQFPKADMAAIHMNDVHHNNLLGTKMLQMVTLTLTQLHNNGQVTILISQVNLAAILRDCQSILEQGAVLILHARDESSKLRHGVFVDDKLR